MLVNEIFYSLQGEGYFSGTPSLFIRFSGCNLKCGFCDTQHQHGTEMDCCHSKCSTYRQEDRCEDQAGRCHIHKCSYDQQHNMEVTGDGIS